MVSDLTDINQSQKKMRRLSLAAIMLAFLLLSIVVSFIVPSRQGPDETAQYDYIRYIARSMGIDSPDRAISKKSFEENYDMRQPLYYSLAVAPYALAEAIFEQRGAPLRAVRLFSGFVGLFWVFSMYRLARELFPSDDAACLFTTAFGSLLPSVIYLSAVVTNRLAEAVFYCGSLVMILKFIRTGLPKLKSSLCFGALMGFGLLTGSQALTIPVLAAIAIPFSLRRQGKSRYSNVLRSAIIAFVTMLVISLWWFVLSQARYGQWIPHPPSNPAIEGGITAIFLHPIKSISLFYGICCWLSAYFWLPFDPAVASIASSNAYMTFISAYTAIALCGMVIFLFVTRGDRTTEEPLDRGDVLLILFLSFIFVLGTILLYTALVNEKLYNYAHLLIPAAGSISAIMVGGFRGFSLNRIPRLVLMFIALLVVVVLNIISIYSLWHAYTV